MQKIHRKEKSKKSKFGRSILCKEKVRYTVEEFQWCNPPFRKTFDLCSMHACLHVTHIIFLLFSVSYLFLSIVVLLFYFAVEDIMNDAATLECKHWEFWVECHSCEANILVSIVNAGHFRVASSQRKDGEWDLLLVLVPENDVPARLTVDAGTWERILIAPPTTGDFGPLWPWQICARWNWECWPGGHACHVWGRFTCVAAAGTLKVKAVVDCCMDCISIAAHNLCDLDQHDMDAAQCQAWEAQQFNEVRVCKLFQWLLLLRSQQKMQQFRLTAQQWPPDDENHFIPVLMLKFVHEHVNCNGQALSQH